MTCSTIAKNHLDWTELPIKKDHPFRIVLYFGEGNSAVSTPVNIALYTPELAIARNGVTVEFDAIALNPVDGNVVFSLTELQIATMAIGAWSGNGHLKRISDDYLDYEFTATFLVEQGTV